MRKPLSANGSRDLLSDLCYLVSERAPVEAAIPAQFSEAEEEIEEEYRRGQRAATKKYEQEKAETEKEYESARRQIEEQFATDHGTVQAEYDEARAAAVAEFEEGEKEAKHELQEDQWEATTISEAAKGGSNLSVQDLKAQMDARWEELLTIRKQAAELMQRRGQWGDFPPVQVPSQPLKGNPMGQLNESAAEADRQFRKLADQKLPLLFEGVRPLGLVLALWGATVYPSKVATGGWDNWYWVAISGASAGIVAAIFGTWLYRFSERRSRTAFLELWQTLVGVGLDNPRSLAVAKAACERLYAKIAARHGEELKRANATFAAATEKATRRRDEALQKAADKYPPIIAALTTRRDNRLREADAKYSNLLQEIEARYKTERDRLQREFSRDKQENEQRRQGRWGEMAEQWQTGIERFQSSLAAMNETCDRMFPDWNKPEWSNWTAAAEIPSAIRFGKHEVKLEQLEGGIPEDGRLRPERSEFVVPAMLPFPERSSLLLRARGEGRDRAVNVIQAAMLRLLTSMPPGKVRYTIIDPVGLGENFSAFMHLADYDEQLVASRIWTDNAHIEQRLGDMTGHMENVIQVYLRNEFQSIQEYNEFAGEMAEAYRILVVANFPANFTETATQRLKSIMASGARCGVFTLLSVDTSLRMPRHFNVADLEPYSLALKWKEGRFIWHHDDYGELPLEFTEPPVAEKFTDIVRSVGSQVKDASRVEVPFETVVPEDGQWWTSNSSEGIDVPLGRAGAMKLQHLNLGKGTSQHVLISGKTGSGKSTMLHALVTNLAIRYSPDEVEVYLVDFKKGVEFKAYASKDLPHARVIAIESEREFGLSVLERLDLELKRRGDQFRKLGVQDVRGFRALKPEAVLPRVLLIIDEFQELFVEDDRISQDAALLLDRLVRQGRAFGIHVLLGSQTLGGAYSLARSTIGQMAVRIALQCSESDAHLILSEDNTAARLLTRPGEAIYNDANGLYEGNHPFQVVWLSDVQRDGYLDRMQELARARNCQVPPAIVFEGNVAADAADNPLLQEQLSQPSWPENLPIVRAWVGAAVAIKDPTMVQFLRQSGNNLLITGHREEAAIGVLATCLVSLAAQHAPSNSKTQFYILDGTRPDAPEVGFWNRLPPVLPHTTRVASPRDVPEVIAEIDAEVTRREQESDEVAAAIYLIIYNLGRFRDLRRDESDFGFSSSFDDDKPASTANQFTHILREGPAFGVHALIWCDTYNNVSRVLDRPGLRDVELRVLFHMNPSDSSNLTDSPAAARLGIHRALLYDESQGALEKFRPYGLPGEQWLNSVKERLFGRVEAKQA